MFGFFDMVGVQFSNKIGLFVLHGFDTAGVMA
jgi:hypothetical protein